MILPLEFAADSCGGMWLSPSGRTPDGESHIHMDTNKSTLCNHVFSAMSVSVSFGVVECVSQPVSF